MTKPTKAEIKKLEANKRKLEVIQKNNKRRVLGYALSLVAFQEVGAGEDKFLNDVREIVLRIRELCKSETGIEIIGYPTDFIKANREEIIIHYPHLKNF